MNSDNQYTPVIKHGNGNGPFISDCPNKTSIHRGFSIAKFDYQRVAGKSSKTGTTATTSNWMVMEPRLPSFTSFLDAFTVFERHTPCADEFDRWVL